MFCKEPARQSRFAAGYPGLNVTPDVRISVAAANRRTFCHRHSPFNAVKGTLRKLFRFLLGGWEAGVPMLSASPRGGSARPHQFDVSNQTQPADHSRGIHIPGPLHEGQHFLKREAAILLASIPLKMRS